jgi:hypothetical protein
MLYLILIGIAIIGTIKLLDKKGKSQIPISNKILKSFQMQVDSLGQLRELNKPSVNEK